ncbi:MAG: hypothetical protein LQ350_002677 [Teloschistes chrysophthalmus]|nr:MAG: hypothetical protein LQ350_002677 [Niorma chrysophthalma]
MAPQHLIHSPKRIGFILDGYKIGTIPKELVKNYLPRLWASQVPFISATGYINLSSIVNTGSKHNLTAFHIICDILDVGTDLGMATKLRKRLDNEADGCAHLIAPEQTMFKIFRDLAVLIRTCSRHQELTYAMSEWFTLHAAETDLTARRLMEYVAALDMLRVDMTGPLHALLRQKHVPAATLRNLHRTTCLRPKTIRTLTNLQKNIKKELRPARHPNGGLIAGGDLRPEDIEDIWHVDPDAITIDLDRAARHYRHEVDLHRHIPHLPHLTIGDVYDEHHLHPHGPRAIAAMPWHDGHLPNPALLGPPRMPSPIPMIHPGVRPQVMRHHTFH